MEALAGGLRTEDAEPDRDGQHGRRTGADQAEATRRQRAARTSWLLDARSQGRRGLDLGCGGARELDRPLLLGEAVGQLRRLRDSRLERGAPLRRERPVCERRQLDDLLGRRPCPGRRRLIDTAQHTVTPSAPRRGVADPQQETQKVVTPRRTPIWPGSFPADGPAQKWDPRLKVPGIRVPFP